MKAQEWIWKAIGAISGLSLVATTIYTLGVTHNQKETKDAEIINTLHNIVIPELRQLHSADSCQTVKLIEIEKNMPTSAQVKRLEQNQNIMLKWNKDALEEIRINNEINELTQRKAEMFDEIKKNGSWSVTQLDIK